MLVLTLWTLPLFSFNFLHPRLCSATLQKLPTTPWLNSNATCVPSFPNIEGLTETVSVGNALTKQLYWKMTQFPSQRSGYFPTIYEMRTCNANTPENSIKPWDPKPCLHKKSTPISIPLQIVLLFRNLVIMWPVVSCRSNKDSYANSVNQSFSIVVISRMKILLLVSTTSIS